MSEVIFEEEGKQDSKPFWKSKTFWFNFLAFVVITLSVISNQLQMSAETGARGKHRFSGVAHRLAGSSAISAVVAMQWPIGDEAATAFNRGFYKALARGESVPEAVVKARWEMRDVSNPVEPLTAVLYMR